MDRSALSVKGAFLGLMTFLLAVFAPHLTPRASAQDRPDEPISGCGKAEALRHRFHAREVVEEWQREYRGQVAGGLRELLEDTDLLHCELEIEVVPGGSPNIMGTNTMTIQSNVDGLSVFTFRLRNQYTISGATVNGATPISVATLSTTTRQATLDRPYNSGEMFTLTIPYFGDAVSAGFGSIMFGTHGGGAPIVASLSEPYYAYTWWPVKDGDFGIPGDNSDKFTADIAIISPDMISTAANGLLQGVDTLPDNRWRYRWSTNYPIATYLVAISSTNYNQWTVTYNTMAGGTMPVLFYIYPELDTPGNRTSWEKAVNMLTTFRGFYGEYPFVNEKYGIYSFPFGGGMEHQTFTGQGGFGESLTAHELAHQWWGDNATCKTWSDIWLNEGFATFSECLWQEYKSGVQDFPAYRSCILARKPGTVNDSVYVPAAQTNSVSRIFSTTYSYYKAAWVLHMLRHFVGSSTFFDILTDYRAAYEGSAATTDEFAAVASSTYGQSIAWFFDQWVYKIGAPAYNYGWESVNVAGQNYLLARVAQTHSSSPTWPAVFTMPVDLVTTVDGLPQTLTVWNDARTQWFVVPISAAATALQFDPDQWILRTGAVSSAYIPGPPKIIATNPTPGANVDVNANLNQISITFHTNVNAAAAHFTLVGTNTGNKTFQLASGTNVNPVVLNLPLPLVNDIYTLTVTTGVTAANSGMTLDGEIADPLNPASLPSGNGVAGGNAVIRFSISGELPPSNATITGIGGRYLSMNPGDGTDPIAFLITPSCGGASTKYLGTPSGPHNVARLVADPEDAAYLTPAQWGASVRVTGTEFVPSMTYDLQADAGLPGSPQLFQPVIGATWLWGNADNMGIVELADILCMVDSYNAEYTFCSLFATDLAGADPDQLVDLADVLAALDAYAGFGYGGPSPCP